MSDAAIPRDEEMLGQLAEMDLSLAKAVHSRALAAEDAEEMASLGRTYQRLARSCRQTIALRDKLIRERRREAAEGPRPMRRPPVRDEAATHARKAELRIALERVIWAEAEGERADYLIDLAEQRLHFHARSPAFAFQALDRQLADLCEDLGLPPACANGWRNLPDPDWTSDDAEVPPPQGEGDREAVEGASTQTSPSPTSQDEVRRDVLSGPPQSRSLSSGRPLAGPGGATGRRSSG